ncbi:hypothetical protein B0H19DRAFT_615089 [Mycena capillaripes]|nr:hypothetical protein B0H19DRAFT_615089 [Mycena capillaripes]
MADKFDEATQKELSAFLEKQQAEARLHASIHNFTGICWEKCVTGTPSTRFSRAEESCLRAQFQLCRKVSRYIIVYGTQD